MKIAMIFAAGRGERLRPITDTLPKSLCIVRGIPLIEHHVQRLAAAGFTLILINHAYLGDMIRRHLGDGSRWQVKIIYLPEPPGALETGGAIANARKHIGDKPLVTVNADIWTDYDFTQLSLPEQSLAHLVLVNKPDYYAQGDFGLSNHPWIDNEQCFYTYTGIACYNPSLLTQLNPGRFSITPLLRQLANDGKLSGEVYQGQWLDIGTPERLDSANQPP